MSAIEMEEFERDIAYLAKMILTENFDERKPVRKPMCEYCDFLPACLQDPDFA